MSALVRKHFWQKFVQNGKCDGYRKRKKTIYRISNDIVQGFEIFPEPRSTLVTVRWAVYPLCQPDANFYSDFYQMYDINDITGQPTLDVAYNRFNLGSIEACAEELNQKVDKILRPYFDIDRSIYLVIVSLAYIIPYLLPSHNVYLNCRCFT